ncbi:hypothetical protein K435DRAFT_670785, partial [Dendrothele bispora CBS 962.96]
ITLSQDITGHKHQNIESQHVALRVADYASGQTDISVKQTPTTRILSIQPTLDHTAEQSKLGWLKNFATIISYYIRSPLFQREGLSLTLHIIAWKIKGMNGDHANNEKAVADAIAAWKHEMAVEELGAEKLLEMEVMYLFGVLQDTNEKKIQEAGGLEAWNRLSAFEKAESDMRVMKELKMRLGQGAYDCLDDAEKRGIDELLWAGCCMHKDQNSFKGGNTQMMSYWEKNGFEGPVILANKANAAKLQPILNPNAQKGRELTDAEVTALESSTRGRVKTAAVAGAVLRNQDERKGQGKVYVAHFKEKHGNKFNQFPDTSNGRFGTYGDAAGVLFAYEKDFIEFLDTVKMKKKHKPGWTNIEKNLVNALKCLQTRQELAVLGLVHQVITVPYLQVVRENKDINALNLGTWHRHVKEHLQKLIDDPSILITPGPDSHVNATLDGKPWTKPKIVDAIHSRLDELPHLTGLLIEFLQGSLATYIRFTSEFAPGSLIDLADKDERNAAWMPATNDINKGALGFYRVMMRVKPTLTILQYNAMVLYTRNNTQAFMDAKFTAKDFEFIMREARVLDASKLEAKR